MRVPGVQPGVRAQADREVHRRERDGSYEWTALVRGAARRYQRCDAGPPPCAFRFCIYVLLRWRDLCIRHIGCVTRGNELVECVWIFIEPTVMLHVLYLHGRIMSVHSRGFRVIVAQWQKERNDILKPERRWLR